MTEQRRRQRAVDFYDTRRVRNVDDVVRERRTHDEREIVVHALRAPPLSLSLSVVKIHAIRFSQSLPFSLSIPFSPYLSLSLSVVGDVRRSWQSENRPRSRASQKQVGRSSAPATTTNDGDHVDDVYDDDEEDDGDDDGDDSNDDGKQRITRTGPRSFRNRSETPRLNIYLATCKTNRGACLNRTKEGSTGPL